MSRHFENNLLEVLDLRFEGENANGDPIHELKAHHVADVLEGLSELVHDFEKAGAFHNEGPVDTELLVRPAQEGSFVLEVCRVAVEHPEALDLINKTVDNMSQAKDEIMLALGLPTVSQIIWWATKGIRADVKNVEFYNDGQVKVQWQDDTVDIIPRNAWDELNKRKPRRKRQLRKIMRPLEDQRIDRLELSNGLGHSDNTYRYLKSDYEAVKPSDEVDESFDIFDIEGRLSAIDFDDPDRWRVDTNLGKRTATVEDEAFLSSVAEGKPLHADDSFILRVREDKTVKAGRTTKKWTILKIWEEEFNNNDDTPPRSASDPA